MNWPAGQDGVMDDAPDWRWQRALYEERRAGAGDRDFTASTDLAVRLARRYLSAWNSAELQGADCRELISGFSFLRDLHDECAPGCTRFSLEAALLAKAGPEFIKANVHPQLVPFAVQMYSLLFFDISGKMESPFWVEKYIFAPAAAEPREELKFSDLVWKVVGYYGGPDRLLIDCLRGRSYKRTDLDWLINHVVGQNAREALKYVHSGGRLPAEITAPAIQRTIGDWDGRVTQMKELTKELDGSTIPESLMTFRGKLRMKDVSAKSDKVERLDKSIAVYADGSLTGT